MAVVRVKKERYRKWVTTNIEVVEIPAEALSCDGKSMWWYLFSRPDDWEYNRTAVIKLIGSGYRVDKAVRELKNLDLLEVIQNTNEYGQFTSSDWLIKSAVDQELVKEVLSAKNKKAITDQKSDSNVSEDPDLVDETALEIPCADKPDPDIPDPDKPDPDNHERIKREILQRETSTKELPPSKSTVVIYGETYEVPQDENRKIRVSGNGRYRTWFLPKHNPQGFVDFVNAHPFKMSDMKTFASVYWDKHKLSPEDIRESIADFPNRLAGEWSGGKIHHPRKYVENAMWENPAPVVFPHSSSFGQNTFGTTINVAAEAVDGGDNLPANTAQGGVSFQVDVQPGGFVERYMNEMGMQR